MCTKRPEEDKDERVEALMREDRSKDQVCESAQIRISSWWKMIRTRKVYLE